jgi:DNA-directed RNA polymerase subunit RPC12/RpoP
MANIRLSKRLDDVTDREYLAYVECPNCKRRWLLAVKKGVKISDAALDRNRNPLKCPNCEAANLGIP